MIFKLQTSTKLLIRSSGEISILVNSKFYKTNTRISQREFDIIYMYNKIFNYL